MVHAPLFAQFPQVFVEADGQTGGHAAQRDPDRTTPRRALQPIRHAQAPRRIPRLLDPDGPAPPANNLTDPDRDATTLPLIRAAIAVSEEEEFRGRIALHALPQSEAFYTKFMEDLGIDPSMERLRYFEMTEEQAHKFMKGGDV